MKNQISGKFQWQAGHRFPWWLVLGVVLIGLAAVFVYIRSQSPQTTLTAQETVRALGPENAPVTIVEYADFNCTTCRTWQLKGIKEQILADYAGQVRFEWRDFPVITALSPKAAEAGWCAQEQDKFWTYHDLLYFMAPIRNVQELKEFAVQAGMDAKAFDACLDSGKYQEIVQSQMKDAYNHGFIGTPSFLVNGEPLVGPPSFAQLSAVVKAALAKKD